MKKIAWQELALLGLCLIMAVSHTLYILKSHQYPVWDENHYMSLALSFYDLFRQNLQTIWSKIFILSDYRQPLYGFVLSLPLFIFGTNHAYRLALLTNGIFYLASILGLYLLARQFFSKTLSLISAVLYAWYGNVLFYLHYTYSETAVAAFIVWATLFLVRSNFFRERKYTVMGGIMVMAAVLTRWIAWPFLAGQVLVCSVGAIRKKNTINLILFAALAILLPLVLYYLPNFQSFSAYISRNRQYSPEWVAQFKFAEMANPFSTRSVMFYFNILSQNTIFLFLPFIAGLLVAIFHPRKYLYPIAALASCYGFLTFFAIWKEDRFIVPIYPMMALITMAFFAHLRWNLLRNWFLVITAVFALVSFLGASWGLGPMGTRGLKDIVLPAFIKHPRRIYLTPLVWKPNPEYVNAHLVVQALLKDKHVDRPVTLVKLFSFEPVDNALSAIFAYEKRNLVTLVTTNKDNQETIRMADYLLTKDEELTGEVNLLTIVSVPIDNSTLYLYKRNR